MMTFVLSDGLLVILFRAPLVCMGWLFFSVFLDRYDCICRMKNRYLDEEKLQIMLHDVKDVCGPHCLKMENGALRYAVEKQSLLWCSKKQCQLVMHLHDFGIVEEENGTYGLRFTH